MGQVDAILGYKHQLQVFVLQQPNLNLALSTVILMVVTVLFQPQTFAVLL